MINLITVHLKNKIYLFAVNIKSIFSFVGNTHSINGCYSPKIRSISSISGPRGYKNFLCSTQMSMKFIMLKNVKMPTIVVILIFMSMINTTSEHLKARKVFIFKHFRFYEHFKIPCSVELSTKKFYNLEARRSVSMRWSNHILWVLKITVSMRQSNHIICVLKRTVTIEHPKQMLKLTSKKILRILRLKYLFILDIY